jgi:hypothetical protein
VSLKTSWLDSGLSGVRIEVQSVPPVFDTVPPHGPPGEDSSSSTTEPPRKQKAAFGERTGIDTPVYEPEPPPVAEVPDIRPGSSRRRRSLGLALGIGLVLTTVLVLAANSGSSVTSSPESSSHAPGAPISVPAVSSLTSTPMVRASGAVHRAGPGPREQQDRARAKRTSASRAKTRAAATSTRNKAALTAKRPPRALRSEMALESRSSRARAPKSEDNDFGF